MRTFLLAMLAIVACGWAIARYVTHPRAPMMVLPAPAPSGSSSDDVHEVPVPDLVPTD